MKRLTTGWQLLAAMLLCNCSMAMAAGQLPVHSQSLLQDSIIIQKLNTTKKHTINIYTNPSHQVLFFSASGEEGRIYQFLLFRQEGRLIKASKIRNRETTVVSKPDKGNYYFEVFSDDTRIENGTIVVQ
jgi:hypothetical protein